MRLEAESWTLENPHRTPFDYCYMDSPFRKERFMGNPNWLTKNKDFNLKDILLDDNMIFQGSCWFAKKSHIDKITPLKLNTIGDGNRNPKSCVVKHGSRRESGCE